MAHYLTKFFQPKSIAVIGASDRPNSVGMKVFKNLNQENFTGKLYPINPKHTHVQNKTCYSSVKEVNEHIDLAVITTPANTVADIIKECGEKKIQVIIVISSGFSETGKTGKELESTILKIAQQYRIRLIGPNCLGVMRPHLKMNATFDNNFPLSNGLALVSQSGAICAAILDWAVDKKIGFSSLISLGNSADVGFGDVLDYLAIDPETRSILLYIEGIQNSRRFMSGLRAAARTKPVIVIKGGRNQQGSRAALSHTGAIIGDDDVFDAALKRAGVIRVMTIDELFLAAEILSTSHYQLKGNRLIIITNGGGAGVMAADHAAKLNVSLPDLNTKTVEELNKVLPPQWSHQNPVDIIGDATPERYHSAITICSKENVDGILTILVPVAMSNPTEVAKQFIHDSERKKKLILACWMGEKQVKSSWKLFEKNKIPYFDTPEKAVSAFSYLADYYQNQKLLSQIPKPFSPQPNPDIETAHSIIKLALNENRKILTTIESKKLLKSFFIPISEPKEVQTKEDAIEIAKLIGFPLVMKINSPDISHKQEAHGVALNITNEITVQEAFDKLIADAKRIFPHAKILGITLEPMYKSHNDRELMIGVFNDKVFGPVISFGSGGTFVEIFKDRALELPPLNRYLAENLISKTNIAKALGRFRNMPPVNIDIIVNILLRVSEMVCSLPYIKEMDINPIIINDKIAISVDARIVIQEKISSIPFYHLAIHPYPDYLITTCEIEGKNITIRPIRPEDAEMEKEFISLLSKQTKYFRFMENIKELSPAMLIRFTQIDYDKEMALVATLTDKNKEKTIGICRYIINPDGETAGFAIVVADACQNKGVGSKLITSLLNAAKIKNLKSIEGIVLATNLWMLQLAKHHGFEILSNNDDPGINVVKKIIKEDL
jgi:acetyltransferase